MLIKLPEKVQEILHQLEAHGYEGYAVGGCIRDVCIGRQPNDWDITTSASPQQVKEVFDHTFDTGIEHGTITVLMGSDAFEITTYRIDGEYEDARHPKEVIFTSRLEEDLKRRDFTINAMAYNDRDGLVDIFGGVQDLEKGIIRCVGDAKERFAEDALRMMRAVRFSAQLGFEIEEGTAEAIRLMAANLSKVSAERIQTELVKLLVSPHPDWIKKAWELGITAVIMPEFDRIMEQKQNNAHHIYSVGEHTLETLRNVRADKVLRLTMLMHDMGKPVCASLDEKGIYHFHKHASYSSEICRQIMKRLKFDNDTAGKVRRLVEHHSMYPQESEMGVRMAIWEIGEELFDNFLEVKQADVMGQHPQVQEKKLKYLKQIHQYTDTIRSRGDCLSLKTLAVTGRDLIADGTEPGKKMGEILERLLMEVLEEPSRNEKEYLLIRSRQLRDSILEADEAPTSIDGE